jgi:hypothetical protein
MYSVIVPYSRLLADLLGASVGIWGVLSLLSKQHKLHGGARVFRWTVVALGIVLFELSQHAHLFWLFGLFGLILAGFFLLFPAFLTTSRSATNRCGDADQARTGLAFGRVPDSEDYRLRCPIPRHSLSFVIPNPSRCSESGRCEESGVATRLT